MKRKHCFNLMLRCVSFRDRLIVVFGLPKRAIYLDCDTLTAGRYELQQATATVQPHRIIAAGTPTVGLLSAYCCLDKHVSVKTPIGRGAPWLSTVEGSGRAYQTCQRDLERDAGWMLGTWRLMYGLGPASASVSPCEFGVHLGTTGRGFASDVFVCVLPVTACFVGWLACCWNRISVCVGQVVSMGLGRQGPRVERLTPSPNAHGRSGKVGKTLAQR